MAGQRYDPNFKKQVDEAVNDFQKEVYHAVGTIYGEQLKEMRSAITDLLGHLWTAAAVEHFDAHQPRAYRRTGGIATPLIVDFMPDYVHFIDGQRIEVRAEIELDTIEVLEAHLKRQVTLREADPSGKNTFEIRTKYPTMFANGQRQHYSLYPSDVGVVGSMQKQTHEYFLAYIFAGPNAPDQPWVYRALGQPKGQNTKRDKTRGLDLINKFLDEIGARPVSAVQNKMEIELKPGSDLLQVILTDFKEGLRKRLNLRINVESVNESSAESIMADPAAKAAREQAQVAAKQAAWNKLYAELQPYLKGGK